jgi:hypothetical protein
VGTVVERLSEPQERRAAQDEILVGALASGLSYSEAGAQAGVVSRTVARRLEDPQFASRVSRRRAELVSTVAGRLAGAAAEAVATVLHELREAERSADRLRAASLLLSQVLRFRRDEELEARLRLVEERLGLGTAEPVSVEDGDEH